MSSYTWYHSLAPITVMSSFLYAGYNLQQHFIDRTHESLRESTPLADLRERAVVRATQEMAVKKMFKLQRAVDAKIALAAEQAALEAPPQA